MNYFLEIPEFIWNHIFNVMTTLLGGIIVACFTSTFLKKREERTRIAGIIVEKRISSEQEILRFLEKELFKEELNINNTSLHDRDIEKILSCFDIDVPYKNAPQYARIFKRKSDFESFFHRFEEIISANKLWLDENVRRHLMLMQLYFSAINCIPLWVKRIPLPEGKHLTDAEFEDICGKLLLLCGIALDSEINGLTAKLDELVVDSIYRLDLKRPRKSMIRNGMWNADMKWILKEIDRHTVFGTNQENFFRLVMTTVYAVKDFDMDKLSDQELDKFLQSVDPEWFAELVKEREQEAEKRQLT